MRRAAGLLLCLTSMIPTVSALATDYDEYRDDFGDGNYSGNDGSLEFEGPWAEFGDTGGASSGLVHVGEEYCSNNECLHIEGYGLVAVTYGATRYADLSMFAQVDLCFDIQIVPQPGLTTTELVVEMWDGSKWTVVKTFDLSVEVDYHKEIDVTEYAGPNSAVRFRVLDVLSGELLGLDLFYTGHTTIDRVTLGGTLEGTSTTSTTSPTTTSTTQPTTTTSKPPKATTSTSGSVPTTTAPGGTASTVGNAGGEPGDASSQTTTTVASTSTTTEDDAAGAPPVGPVPPDGPTDPALTSGLRVTAGGVIADYRPGMMGDLDMTGIEVLGFEVGADFSMAVEFFETARIWIAGLALLIAAVIIAGLDRKRGLTGR